jgi:hypothetical protein
LGRKQLERLTDRFFVTATTPHGIGGYVSILQYNPDRILDEVNFDDETAHDWALIKDHICKCQICDGTLSVLYSTR